MTLAAFVKALRERAWTLSGKSGIGPSTQGLLHGLVERVTQQPLTPEQGALALVLDALRMPERGSDLSDQLLDDIPAQTVLELGVLVDLIERGIVTSGEISDALRRARLHAVPPSR